MFSSSRLAKWCQIWLFWPIWHLGDLLILGSCRRVSDSITIELHDCTSALWHINLTVYYAVSCGEEINQRNILHQSLWSMLIVIGRMCRDGRNRKGVGWNSKNLWIAWIFLMPLPDLFWNVFLILKMWYLLPPHRTIWLFALTYHGPSSIWLRLYAFSTQTRWNIFGPADNTFFLFLLFPF